MKLHVDVKPNSKKPGIEKITETHWQVRVRVPPVEGKANRAVIEMVAKETGVPKSLIKIVSGESSRKKTLELITD